MDVKRALQGLDEEKRKDAAWLVALMEKLTGHTAKFANRMWSCGSLDLVYASGRKVTVPEIGFVSCKGNLTMHLAFNKPLKERIASLPKPLGKTTCGVGCLHIKSLEDVDKKMLERLCRGSVADLRAWAKRCSQQQALKQKPGASSSAKSSKSSIGVKRKVAKKPAAAAR
mmetsp:Transcript_24163/g.56172  ORF Transcript_24163/g.56172 Transcript_24163/m.56172 type:complete len:170 (-) Transcript_24163:201-710(-)|eukprot:CAMPEP_0178414856 /NCGR_PEP_ID=MMETSP0689_2-20121128/23251_1 /TAXON_ID=160604 /ORGANISM="Amphidinium massartii, Strain CS-259" /LENGTH=169 /DNA_ID=CAMNT_0020036157 /DNA_START=69 /DNA_END=578 /DNA_ORIENTATION=+